MKKLDKKGFTLIELLAVIVVLAVIMVIATQQVNRTIKKSRGNAFYETTQGIRKSLQTVCATDNKLTKENVKDSIEASDLKIYIGKQNNKGARIVVVANVDGKFSNIIVPKINTNTYKKIKWDASQHAYVEDTDATEGKAQKTLYLEFEADCNTEYTGDICYGYYEGTVCSSKE